jgi:hypothetical protein
MNEHVLMPEGLADDLLLAAASGNLPTSGLMKGEDPISQVGLANFLFPSLSLSSSLLHAFRKMFVFECLSRVKCNTKD